MMQKLSLYAAALTTVCLLPLTAMAQDDGFDISAAPVQPQQTETAATRPLGEFTLGTQWVGGTNTGLYGRYNGFTNEGFDVLFGFKFGKRDAWDSGDTFYYDVSGINLNFQTGNRLADGFSDSTYSNRTSNRLGPTAELSVAFGEQGKWGITADYDAISYTGNIINSIYTVTGTEGVLNNGLAPSGGASNAPLTAGSPTSFNAPTLSQAMKEFQTGTRRDILTFGGKYIVDDWTFTAGIRHDHKDGTLEESLRATYGGQAFTLPIDYDTDRFDVSAAYNLPDFQAILAYSFSRFTANDLGVLLPYPVSKASLNASSGPYAQTALYSLPPSTSAHYVTIMMGDTLKPGTRINLNGRFGVELQDSMFPANSADPNLSNTLGNPAYHWFDNLNNWNQGTSASSPDASAWIYQGSASINSRLATDLTGRASYSFDGRNVDINQYEVWIGGSSPDATANTAVYVVPQEWFKQTANVELDYRLIPESNTKVTVSYSFNNTERTNAQVEHSTTNSAGVHLSTMLGSDFMGRLSYDYADRSGTLIYGTAWGNLETGAPEEYGTPSGAYYQAPMTSHTVVLRGDYAPSPRFSGGVFLKYRDEHFHYPEIDAAAPTSDTNLLGRGMGIVEDSNLTVGPDVSYRPNKDVDLHAYYTYEMIFFDNRGNGACANSNTGNCLGSVGYFQNKYTSHMNTAGMSADWLVNPKLKIKGEYNYSSGSVMFGEFNGVMVASVSQLYQNVTPYPDIDSTMHDLRLTAVYQLTPNIEWSLMYAYNMFHNNDWNFLTPPIQTTTNTSTTISILTPGYPPPRYDVSTVGTMVRVAL